MLFTTSMGVTNVGSKQVVKCVAGGTITVASPVGVYTVISGSGTADDPYVHTLYCLTLAVDGNTRSGQWGVSEVAGTSGDVMDIVVHGRCTLASGGTLNQVITAISNAGVITDAVAGVTNVDLALGVSLSATDIYIY